MVGAGYIADYHTRGLQSIEGVEVVAVVAKTVDEAQKFANKTEILEITAETQIDNYTESIKNLTIAIEAAPDKFEPYFFRGLAKYSLGDYDGRKWNINTNT